MFGKVNLKIESMNKKQEFVAVVVLSLLLVLGILIGVGTINSGWHLVDDHELLRFFYEMKYEGRTIPGLIKEWVSGELWRRFRPLYYTNRIISSAVLGINPIRYAIMKASEIIVSCIFLYYCGRLMGAGKVYSFLFAAISWVGYQSPIWWKLGPQEAQCTLLFSIGFFCMLHYLKSDKLFWAWGSIIACFCMCNYKESFILLIPFLMLYVLYYDIQQQEKSLSWRMVLECIRSRLWYYLILGIIFTVLMLFIVFYVGIGDYDGVTPDFSVSWRTYIEAYQGVLSADLKWFKRFGIIFILILLTYWEDLKKLWKEMLLVASFLLPQIILHAQSGIAERYMLPSTIGYALFFIVIVPKSNIFSGKRKALYQFCILLLLLAHIRVAMREADYYRYRGESVTTMLETVRNMTENKEDIKILSCLRPNEEGNLTMNFYMGNYGYDNVYYWTEDNGTINQAWGENSVHTEDRYVNRNLEDMDVVVMYNQEDRHWCYTPTLDLSDFTYQKCGTLDIYVRNGRGIEAVDTTVDGLKINF